MGIDRDSVFNTTSNLISGWVNNLATNDDSVMQYRRDMTLTDECNTDKYSDYYLYWLYLEGGKSAFKTLAKKQLNDAVRRLDRAGYKVRRDGYIYKPQEDGPQSLDDQINELLINTSLVNLLPKVYDGNSEYYRDKEQYIKRLISLYSSQSKYEWGLNKDDDGGTVIYFDTPGGRQISFHLGYDLEKDVRGMSIPGTPGIQDMYGYYTGDYASEGRDYVPEYQKPWVGNFDADFMRRQGVNDVYRITSRNLYDMLDELGIPTYDKDNDK